MFRLHDSTGNGVPPVNVQTPSAAGVSHNTYGQFDVDEKGATLNNSRKGAQTQLGGQVSGNPWMARGAARVILNEVVSSNRSKLRGYVEVGGSVHEEWHGGSDQHVRDSAQATTFDGGTLTVSALGDKTDIALANVAKQGRFLSDSRQVTARGNGLDRAQAIARWHRSENRREMS